MSRKLVPETLKVYCDFCNCECSKYRAEITFNNGTTEQVMGRQTFFDACPMCFVKIEKAVYAQFPFIKQENH